MLTPGQLFERATLVAKATRPEITDQDREEMALGLFFQGYSAGRAAYMAFVELEDNDGALQMLARHRINALASEGQS